MDLSRCCTCKISKTSPLSFPKTISTHQEMWLQEGCSVRPGHIWPGLVAGVTLKFQVPPGAHPHQDLSHLSHSTLFGCRFGGGWECQQLGLQALLQSYSYTDLVLDHRGICSCLLCSHHRRKIFHFNMEKALCGTQTQGQQFNPCKLPGGHCSFLLS